MNFRIALYSIAMMVVTLFSACHDDDDFVNTLQPTHDAINIESAFFGTVVSGRTLTSIPTKVSTDTFLLGEYTADTIGKTHGDLLVQFDAPGGISLPQEGGVTNISDTLLSLNISFTDIKNTSTATDTTLHLQLQKMTSKLGYRTNYTYDMDVSSFVSGVSLVDTTLTLSKSNMSFSVVLPATLTEDITKAIESAQATFLSTDAFTSFFPGLYLKATGGSALITVSSVSLSYSFKYKATSGATISYSVDFPANDNVRQVNILSQVPSSISYTSSALVMSPMSSSVQVTIPYESIKNTFGVETGGFFTSSGKKVSVNSAMLYLNASNKISTVGVPSYLLLLRSSKFPSYFSQASTAPDNVNSMLAVYNSSDSSYAFSLKYYIQDLMQNGVSDSGDTVLVAVPVSPVMFSSSVLGVVPDPTLKGVVLALDSASTGLGVVMTDW